MRLEAGTIRLALRFCRAVLVRYSNTGEGAGMGDDRKEGGKVGRTCDQRAMN